MLLRASWYKTLLSMSYYFINHLSLFTFKWVWYIKLDYRVITFTMLRQVLRRLFVFMRMFPMIVDTSVWRPIFFRETKRHVKTYIKRKVGNIFILISVKTKAPAPLINLPVTLMMLPLLLTLCASKQVNVIYCVTQKRLSPLYK